MSLLEVRSVCQYEIGRSPRLANEEIRHVLSIQDPGIQQESVHHPRFYYDAQEGPISG